MTSRFKLALFLATGLFFLILPSISKAAVDCTATSTTGVPQLECEALMAIYNNTTGPGWNRQTNWNTTSSISTWYGVTVSGGHVTVLNLNSASSSNNNLIGTLPTELGNLTRLTTLTLQKNTALTGSIPSSIGNLTLLTSLDISQSNLTGSIPTTIGNLTNLLTLTFLSNNLTGGIPSQMSNLTALTSLTLSSNASLGGTIPTGFSSLTHLVTLALAGDALTGSIPSGLATTLKTLDVHNNQLSGPIPHDIASIALTTFNIRTNNFVFSDFDADFNSYCSGVTSSVSYNLQGSVDTNRTVNAPVDLITITPSLTADANDHYQWKFNGTNISGATSRVYTKANPTLADIGTYTYTVTSSIVTGLTLTSNSIQVNVGSNILQTGVTYTSTLDSLSLVMDVAYNSSLTNQPIVLTLHGYSGPYISDDIIQRLAQKGVFAIKNYKRSYGGSQGTPDDSAREVSDFVDAIEYVKAHYSQYVDVNNINVIGYSGGGGNTYGLLTKFPDYLRTASIFFGMSDYGYDDVDGWYNNGATTTYQPGLRTHIGGTPAQVRNNYYARAHYLGAKNNPATHIQLFYDYVEPICPPINGSKYLANNTAAGFNNVVYRLSDLNTTTTENVDDFSTDLSDYSFLGNGTTTFIWNNGGYIDWTSSSSPPFNAIYKKLTSLRNYAKTDRIKASFNYKITTPNPAGAVLFGFRNSNDTTLKSAVSIQVGNGTSSVRIDYNGSTTDATVFTTALATNTTYGFDLEMGSSVATGTLKDANGNVLETKKVNFNAGKTFDGIDSFGIYNASSGAPISGTFDNLNISAWTRWSHGYPQEGGIEDLITAENLIIPDIVAGTWSRPYLQTSSTMFIPGYIKTGQFEIMLGNGEQHAGNLTYNLSGNASAPATAKSFTVEGLTGTASTTLQVYNLLANTQYVVKDNNLTDSTSSLTTTTTDSNGTLNFSGLLGSIHQYDVFQNDTTSPSVLLTAPINGATVTGSAVTLTATSSDNIGVTSVQFQVDGVNVGSAGATSPYSISWDSTGVSTGSHTISVIATDGSSNSASSSISVTVSNLGPAISAVNATSTTNSSTHIIWTTSPAANSLVQYGLVANNYTVSSTLDSSLVTNHNVTLSNLNACSFYHFRVVSVDVLANQSVGSDNYFLTTGCTSNATVKASSTVSANIASSSLVSILSNQLGLNLTIPSGFTATSSSATFQAKQLDSTTFFAGVTAPSGYTPVDSYLYNLEALIDTTTSLTTFVTPLDVSISYSLNDISGLIESSLIIERYDNGVWTPLPSCFINSSLHQITCKTSNFSDFALFGQAATVLSSSLGGSGSLPSSFYQPPIEPVGGFSLSINNDVPLTNNRMVNLSFNAGSNVTQMVVATNNPTLSLTSLQPYQANYSYDLCVGQTSCPDGQYTIYARFYTAYGQSSIIVSKTIELKSGVIILNQAVSQLANRLKGRLLLQVEDGGRIWYVGFDGQRYEATFATALDLFRKLAIGITDKDLQKISLSTSKTTAAFGNKHKGKLFLQVQDGGRIWYVGTNGKRYEITFANMLDVFRKLSLGITNADLDKIEIGN